MGNNPTKIYKEEINNLITNGRFIVLINRNVFDITDFEHPYSKDIIKKRLGKDIGNDMKFHSSNARKLLKKYYIGKLCLRKK